MDEAFSRLLRRMDVAICCLFLVFVAFAYAFSTGHFVVAILCSVAMTFITCVQSVIGAYMFRTLLDHRTRCKVYPRPSVGRNIRWRRTPISFRESETRDEGIELT